MITDRWGTWMVVRKTRRSRRVVTSGLLALMLVLVPSCASAGSSGPAQPGGTTGASSGSTASTNRATTSEGPQAAASRAAVTAYLGYISAFAAASQIPDPDYPGLNRYMNDPLLSRTRHELRSMRDKGVVQVGAQTATVTGTTVDLASAQPSVTVDSCLDYSALRLVYKSNHSPVPNSQLTKTKLSATTTVWQYKNGQWLVNDTKTGSDPC